MVDIATWPAFTASLSTPAEQEDSELIVKPRGWKSGLRSVRLEVRASAGLAVTCHPLKYFFPLSVVLSQALENFSPQLSLGAFEAKVGLVGLAPTFLEPRLMLVRRHLCESKSPVSAFVSGQEFPLD